MNKFAIAVVVLLSVSVADAAQYPSAQFNNLIVQGTVNGDMSAGTSLAPGATTALTTAQRAVGFLTPADFGAFGSGGGADDTAGLNAYFNYVRTTIQTGKPPRAIKLGYGRTYTVSGPLNLTGLNDFDIDLNGSQIKNGTGGAYAVFDMLGTYRTALHNGKIYCGTQASPCIDGLQFGRYTMTQGYAENSFSDIIVDGYYTQTPIKNSGSETLIMKGVKSTNRYVSSGAPAYVLIEDGIYHWPLVSNFVTVNVTPDTYGSYTDQKFDAFVGYNVGNGGGVWMAAARGLSFRHSYMQVNSSSPSGTIYCGANTTVGQQMYNLDWGVHSEIAPSTTLFFTGCTNPTVYGLNVEDYVLQTMPSGTVFKADAGVTSVSLYSVNLDLPAIYQATTKIFDQPSIYSLNGQATIMSADAPSWNGSMFSGDIFTDNRATFLAGATMGAGGYSVIDPTGKTGSTVAYTGSVSAGNGTVRIGGDTVNGNINIGTATVNVTPYINFITQNRNDQIVSDATKLTLSMGGATVAQFFPSQAAYFAQGISSPANVVSSIAFKQSVTPSVAAAGTTQATATALTTASSNVNNGTGGVMTMTCVAGLKTEVFNQTGATINVYPPSGDTINAHAVNAAIALATATKLNLTCLSVAQIGAGVETLP